MKVYQINQEQGLHTNGIVDFSPVLSGILAGVEDGTTVSFAPGTYHFWPDNAIKRVLYLSNTDSVKYPEKDIAILLENKKKLTIQGNNTAFIFHGNVMMFAVLGCEDIRFEGITFDYACPSTIDVTVTAAGPEGDGAAAQVSFSPVYGCETDGRNVTWESERSPYTGKAYWTGKNGLVLSQHYHRDTGMVQRTSEDLFYNCTAAKKTGSGGLRLLYSGKRNISAGDVFQIRDTIRDSSGIFISGSRNVTLYDLRIGYMHGIGIICQCTENLEVGHVRFQTVEAGRSTASAADFLQVSGCKGKVWIHDSVFDNPHDDPINVHGTFLKVRESAGRKLVLQYCHDQTMGFQSVFEGDVLRFYDSGTLLPVGEPYNVVRAEGPGSENLTLMEIELDREFSEVSSHDIVAENISWTPDVLIENNRFEAVSTRGVLVSTCGSVVIRDNTFDRMLMAGIYISCDANGWYESGPVRDVLIERNTFSRCNSYAVLVEPTNTVLSEDKKVHENIRIRENTLTGMRLPAVRIKSSGNVSVTDNRAEQCSNTEDAGFVDNISSHIEEMNNSVI